MIASVRAYFLFALGAYAGIGTAVVIAGPAVFRHIDSRTEAGDAFAAVLRGTTTVDVALGIVIALTGVVWLRRTAPGMRRTLTALAIALLLAGIGYYRFGIMPAMRAERGHFASADAEEVAAHRAAFDRLHTRYERLYGANLCVCVAAFVLAAGLGDRVTNPTPVSERGSASPP